MIARGEDGKVRHFKSLSEDLVEKEIVKVCRGAYVLINAGPHKVSTAPPLRIPFSA